MKKKGNLFHQGKPGGKKNYGWGAKLFYAGKMALRVHISHRYSTFGTLKARWVTICKYLKDVGIRDAKDIDIDVLIKYAESLHKKVEAGEISITYATSLLSSANVVLSYLRGDRSVHISPKKYLGPRRRARTVPPRGMDVAQVDAAARSMEDRGHVREALVIKLIRRTFDRKKEACLLDARKALQDGLREGLIRTTRGTKAGRGRSKPREAEISESDLTILREAAALQGDGSCLIPPHMNLKKFMSSVDRAWSQVRGDFGLGKIHDLRAAGACEIYERETGFPAPVMAGGKILAGKEKHRKGQAKVGQVLGHDRLGSCAAYCGRG